MSTLLRSSRGWASPLTATGDDMVHTEVLSAGVPKGIRYTRLYAVDCDASLRCCENHAARRRCGHGWRNEYQALWPRYTSPHSGHRTSGGFPPAAPVACANSASSLLYAASAPDSLPRHSGGNSAAVYNQPSRSPPPSGCPDVPPAVLAVPEPVGTESAPVSSQPPPSVSHPNQALQAHTSFAWRALTSGVIVVPRGCTHTRRTGYRW